MGAMGELRVQSFSNPAYLTRVHEGEEVPALGWAIRADGDVFYDGVHVGHSGKFMFDRDRATPYAEITYEEIDGAS
jgi:hypothetical protein